MSTKSGQISIGFAREAEFAVDINVAQRRPAKPKLPEIAAPLRLGDFMPESWGSRGVVFPSLND